MLALAWLCAASACLHMPTGNLRQTQQRVTTGDDRTSTSTTLVELGLQDDLGPGLQYRVSDRLINTYLDVTSSGARMRDHRVFHQPSLDLILSAGTIRWIQGLELQQTSTSPSDGEDNELLRTDVLEKVEWSPVDFPKVTAWIDDRTLKDDIFIDQDDTELVLQIEEERGPFRYFYTIEREDFRDNRSDLERERTESLLRATYQDSFLDQAVTTDVTLFTNQRENTTRFRAGLSGVLPAGEIPFLVQGLSLLDLTPGSGVLGATPTLIDGDEGTSTGINIGGFVSGGDVSWNMGAELPPGSSPNLILLSTVDEVDNLFVNQFAFSVWVSDDNNFWNLVTGNASFTYEPTERRFRIVFPQVTGTFIKVVNTSSPAAAPAVLVSEIRVFDTTSGPALGETESVTKDSTTNLTGNVTWQVNERLRLGYDVFAQVAERKNNDVLSRDETRLDHGMTAFWTPTDIVDVSLRGNVQDTDDPVLGDQDFSLFSGLVDVRPLETLDFALSYTETSRKVMQVDTLDTEALQLRASAQLLETLDGEITLESNEQQDFVNDRVVKRTIFTLGTTAELTPELDVTIRVRDVNGKVTGSGAADFPDPTEKEFEVSVFYRPSDQFTAEAELRKHETFAGSGLDQRYRIDWIPFPDGAIDVQLDVQRRVVGIVDTAVDRYQLLTRWTFNPKAYLEFNYSIDAPEGGERTDIAQLSVNVRL